jgi:hypothetical protein
MTELEPEYGCITFLRREVVAVGDLPQRMKFGIDVLLDQVQRGAAVMRGGTVSYGRHEDGGLVWYQIVGWDLMHGELILELDTVVREAGRHGAH